MYVCGVVAASRPPLAEFTALAQAQPAAQAGSPGSPRAAASESPGGSRMRRTGRARAVTGDASRERGERAVRELCDAVRDLGQ